MNLPGLRRTHPLGVFRDHDTVALIGREKYSATNRLVFGHAHGQDFAFRSENPSIVLPLGRKQTLEHISDVRLTRVLTHEVMTYTALHEGRREVRVALHAPDEEMNVWDVPALHHHLAGSGMIVGEYLHNGQYVLYYGDNDLRVAFSKNLIAWHTTGHALATPRRQYFDQGSLKVVAVERLEQGLLVLYESRETHKNQVTLSFGYALFANDDPESMLWRSDEPLYQETFKAKEEPVTLGAIVYERQIVFYLTSTSHKLLRLEVEHPYPPRGRARRGVRLHRFAANPVMSPGVYEWESQAVLNPAAFVDQGRIHLLYRAMGPDGISRLGYASSADGVHFDERLDRPVYTPHLGFGAPSGRGIHGTKAYHLIANPSGGGWAGCEDPRAVVIDGRLYLSFVAFDGWNFVRQALTSIPLGDFRARDWSWKQPQLMSKPGEIHKNWVIFPEKINGKYAILHGLSPKVHIDYIDSLDDFDGDSFIDSLPPAGGMGYHDAARQKHWDNRVRGAGAPPIKTALGWLLLYHANDKRDPGKYKLGAMLLDLEDPTKVLYRSTEPILEPEEWYENDGKPGVVYTCGAVIAGDNLVVYYGAGDKHIAVARANAQEFLRALSTNHPASLAPAGTVR